MGNDNILQWETTVEDALNKFARKLSKDRKDDLRQEIYLAYLQAPDEIKTTQQAFEIAHAVLTRNRMASKRDENRTKISTSGLLADDVAELDKHAVELFRFDNAAQKLPLADAVDQLPAILQEILNETFYEGLTQDEIAVKHQKSPRWVRYKKDQALTFLRNYLNSRRTICQ